MKRVRVAEIIWMIGIVLSIFALFSIVPVETALNALVISFAVFALIWINIAKKNLSRGSSIAIFAVFLFSSIVFFLLSSIFGLVIKIFPFFILVWLSYIFLAIAYLLLVISAYRLMRIGKEFGFVAETEKIKKLFKQQEKRLQKSEKRLGELEKLEKSPKKQENLKQVRKGRRG